MIGLWALAAASVTSCPSLDGFPEALAASRPRWIVAGEIHGTNEMPAMFANLVCLASRSAPVVVGVEQPEKDQPAIDAYLDSDGGKEAEKTFLRAGMWRSGQPDGVRDGRSSRAMFKLFQTLRLQYRQGRVVRVIAFEPALAFRDGAFRMPWLNDQPVDHGAFEKRMADLLKKGVAATQTTQTTQTTLVLVGSAHARSRPSDQFPALWPMASFLPQSDTLTLLMTSHGKGRAWTCLEAGCGVHEVEQASRPQRGVVLEKRPNQPYSGTLFLGTPVTVSLPQKSAD